MEKVSLSVDLVNGILQYLGTKPFMEVAGMITKIQAEAGPQGPAREEPAQAE